MNKKLTALAVYLFLSIVSVVSAQRRVVLQPARAIELALQNNEAVKQAQKVVERAKANLRVSKAIYLPQVGLTGEYQRQKDGDIDDRDYITRAQASMLLAQFGEIPESLDAAQQDVRKSEIEYERAKKQSVHAVRNLWNNIILTQEEIQERRAIETELNKNSKAPKLSTQKNGYLSSVVSIQNLSCRSSNLPLTNFNDGLMWTLRNSSVSSDSIRWQKLPSHNPYLTMI